MQLLFNVLYAKKEKINPKCKKNRGKQVIVLMIPHGGGWNYLA